MANNQQVVSSLKVILGSNVESNIIAYICSIKNEEDFEEFMHNIVNKQEPAHVNAYNAIKNAIFGGKSKTLMQKQQENAKKSAIASTVESNEKGKTPAQSASGSKKGKKKFRDIKEFQEEKKEKEGRHACDCMGQEHEFMNNCLQCGRIHCFKEGPGPCLFCGNPISIRGEIQSSSNAKALAKPKLNKVFDDDNDYFKMKGKKLEGSKQKMVVALDFASRRVIESTQEDMKLKQLLLEDSIQHLKRVEEVYRNIQKRDQRSLPKHHDGNDELVDLLVQMRHKKPTEREDLGEEDSAMPLIRYNTNILDEDLIATVDQGLCISLHQPYASLLVAGVKRQAFFIVYNATLPHHRFFCSFGNSFRFSDTTLRFPQEYPTGCLLGCVTVEDCLDQEAYKKRFGDNEESTSPYVMICSNPVILPIFYPISGKHKI
ncbi:hypothetical protein D910_01382, partial [Dendroctonus ponderosae]